MLQVTADGSSRSESRLSVKLFCAPGTHTRLAAGLPTQGMGFNIGHVTLLAAVALLLHAGYSANHYESLVTDRYGDAEGWSQPVDIYVEVALALILGLVGSLLAVGTFVPIHSSGESSLNAFHKLFAPRWDFAPLRVAQSAPAKRIVDAAAAVGQEEAGAPAVAEGHGSRRAASPTSRGGAAKP